MEIISGNYSHYLAAYISLCELFQMTDPTFLVILLSHKTLRTVPATLQHSRVSNRWVDLE